MSRSSELFQSAKQYLIGGVCAGFADHFNFDVNIVRIAFAAIALVTHLFFMAIIYILAMIFLPEKPDQ